jgi:signal transduction histidine kinase
MGTDGDLDLLRIGKFFQEKNKTTPLNHYAEFVLNVISMNTDEEPYSYLSRLFSTKNKVFELGGYRFGINEDKDYLFVIDLTDYVSDINYFVDLLSLQHEIKNPLTVIDGASQLLKLRSDDRFVLDSADIIQKESGRIKNILETLSVFSRELCIDTIVLKDFLDELVSSIKSIYINVGFFVDVDPEIVTIKGDRVQLYRAFFNVLKNSCDARNDTNIRVTVLIDSSLKLKSKKSGKNKFMLHFTVSDTSGGIPKEHATKVFTPFFSTKSKGSGLGLFIAKTIIEKHYGRIYFNTNTGIGTTFHILLPFEMEESR